MNTSALLVTAGKEKFYDVMGGILSTLNTYTCDNASSMRNLSARYCDFQTVIIEKFVDKNGSICDIYIFPDCQQDYSEIGGTDKTIVHIDSLGDTKEITEMMVSIIRRFGDVYKWEGDGKAFILIGGKCSV